MWFAVVAWGLLLSVAARGSFGINNDLNYPKPLLSIPLSNFVPENAGRRRLLRSPELKPLFPGMGVHYAFLWVGTPPQRVSVIVDTGSHHTAFPCTGCKCGKHMDPFFDPKASSTSKIANCGKDKCYFRQSYSEGSSWHAYKVVDQVWLGDETLPNNFSQPWSVPFEFGCQDSETGLFRSQHIDGIMGMSAASDTLHYRLYDSRITSTRTFSMCFNANGGLLTLGGVDPSIHTPNSNVLFAKLIKSSGWYTVRLLRISLKDSQNDQSTAQFDVGADRCNLGKGTIVDSGTTDTYLPAVLKNRFANIFHKISGIRYSNNNIFVNHEQFKKLPIIVYHLEGISHGKVTTISIECHPNNYAEKIDRNMYAFRIYFTESQGAVLGSNFMKGFDIIFDIDSMKIGFAQSSCKRDSQSNITSTDVPQFEKLQNDQIKQEIRRYNDRIKSITRSSVCNFQLVRGCSATCGNTNYLEELGSAYQTYFNASFRTLNLLKGLRSVKGSQSWNRRSCFPNASLVDPKLHPQHIHSEECVALCDPIGNQYWSYNESLRAFNQAYYFGILANESLVDTSSPSPSPSPSSSQGQFLFSSDWTSCNYACNQYRLLFTMAPNGSLNVAQNQSRSCYSYQCPIALHDMVLKISCRISLWSGSYSLSTALRPFARSISRAQVSSLLEAISLGLQIPEDRFHSTFVERSSSFQDLSVFFRIKSTDFNGIGTSKPFVLTLLNEINRDRFRFLITQIMNGNSTESGIPHWLAAQDLLFVEASIEKEAGDSNFELDQSLEFVAPYTDTDQTEVGADSFSQIRPLLKGFVWLFSAIILAYFLVGRFNTKQL